MVFVFLGILYLKPFLFWRAFWDFSNLFVFFNGEFTVVFFFFLGFWSPKGGLPFPVFLDGGGFFHQGGSFTQRGGLDSGGEKKICFGGGLFFSGGG